MYVNLTCHKFFVLKFLELHQLLQGMLYIKLYRKRIYASLYVKYLSVLIDENLNWKKHTNKISTKLIKGNATLSKLRHFVNKDILL